MLVSATVVYWNACQRMQKRRDSSVVEHMLGLRLNNLLSSSANLCYLVE